MFVCLDLFVMSLTVFDVVWMICMFNLFSVSYSGVLYVFVGRMSLREGGVDVGVFLGFLIVCMWVAFFLAFRMKCLGYFRFV